MGLTTRLWTTGYADNLLTTVPKAVRTQLELTDADKITWRVDGGVAEVARWVDGESAGDGYTLYKQSRGNSLYTAIPMNVGEQLRLTSRSRAEWELAGDRALVRRG